MSFTNDSLDLGDAGWDPDFQVAAQLSEQMYRSATDRLVDGTIALDPYAVSAPLSITGPVEVPPYGTFTGDNFFAKINLIVNVRKDPTSGKKALPTISEAVVKRLFATPIDLWPAVLSAGQAQARGRHIQLFMHDSAIAELIERARYDGSLVQRQDGEDYLTVVDANVGATKGDSYIRK